MDFAFGSTLALALGTVCLGADSGANQYVVDHPGTASMIVENSNTPRFGLKPAEASAFHGNLARLRDLLLAQPAFHPPRGVEVKGYIRADHGAPVVGTAPVPGFGHVIYYPFVLSSKTRQPFRMIASPWQIEISFNAPGSGLSTSNLRDPAGQLKLLYAPEPAGQLHGFPVYRDGDNNEFVVLSSTGKPAWIPVTREEYVRLGIRIIEKDLAAGGGADLTKQRLEHHRNALARMSPEERAAQAQYGDSGDYLGPSLAPLGKKGIGRAYVKANPGWFDPSRPRSDLQLIVMRFNWRGDLNPDRPAIGEYGNAAPLRLWETLHTSDWKAVAAALAAK
jgi:hypothetical protein